MNEEKRKLREEQKLKRLEEEEKYDFLFSVPSVFSVSIAMCQINIPYGMKYGIEVMPTHIHCKMLMFCAPA